MLESPPMLLTGKRVGIRPPNPADRDEFIELARASVEHLRPWIDPPTTPERFDTYLQRRAAQGDQGVLVCELASGRIAGVINVSNIVRGFFQSAFLGYWIGAPFARRGLMTEAMLLLLQHAFGELKLHRLEANIQPGNQPSIALARRCGFCKEGYSPKYLQILGEWRDHERWAIRSDQEILDHLWLENVRS
jgi:ribosomal-protein-alanine N-acetyltransferase